MAAGIRSGSRRMSSRWSGKRARCSSEFEINPEVADSFRLELAHALLVREVFPAAPLKYMPPTKHMSGNVFAGYLHDGFFNLAALLTGQAIILPM